MDESSLWIKTLYLKNFRKFKESLIHFSPSLNVFTGDNAAGKTTLLEAIYLIATGKSFRTQLLSELISEGESYFFLHAEIEKEQITQSIKIYYDKRGKRLEMGSSKYSSYSPLLGLVPSVLYTPYDIELIAGAPSHRRRFLNIHLAQSDPLYVHHLTCYWRAMKQRNCLLKAKNIKSIECWEEKMAQSASYIMGARQKVLEEMKKPLDKLHLSLENEPYELIFLPSAKENYLEQLKKNRAKEMEVGQSMSGPHRDDFSFLIQEKLAKSFASEGQKKTAIAAVKLAEWQRLFIQTGLKPLIGFDDIDQHLDQKRQQKLREHFSTLSQVFITTPKTVSQEGNIIHIEKGILFQNNI